MQARTVLPVALGYPQPAFDRLPSRVAGPVLACTFPFGEP